MRTARANELAVLTEGTDATVERGLVIRVEAFDWNCPQHITPRYTQTEVDALIAPLQARIAALEGR